MGLIQRVAQFVLVIVNIIFLLLGLTLMILGFTLRFGKSLYEPYLEQGTSQLQQVLSDTSLGDFDVSSINLGEIMVGMSLGFIVGGMVLCGITIFGCCGACYKIKLFLFAYAIVVIVFLVLELVTIGILYGKPDVVKDPVKGSMTDYKGLGSSDVYSLGWNIIMIQYKCCGVDDYTDFDVSNQWKDEVSAVTLVTPISCCKTLPTGSTASDLDCCTSYNETLSYGMEGCYKMLWDKSLNNASIIVPVLLVCGIVQVSFIIFAFVLMRASSEQEKIGQS